MLQATLYEPQCAPPLPDLMMLDEEEACCREDSWPVGLANFGGSTAVGTSAPVPIAAPRAPLCHHVRSSADLLDSMESTQTLLGASLAGEGSSASHSYGQQQQQQSAMRFVPVPVAPPTQRALYLQPQPQYQPAAEQYALGATDSLLFGGYGVVAEPQAYPFPVQQHNQHQHYHHQQEQEQGYAAGWDLPPARLAVPFSAPAAAAHYAGISSFDMTYPYSAQFGGQMSMPQSGGFGGSQAQRRGVSEDALQFGNYHINVNGSYQAAAAGPTHHHQLADGDSMGSESSDEDVHHHHHHHADHHHGGPSAASLMLERSGSSRRALASPSSLRGLSTASPRTICLKLKAARPRLGAARAAATAAAAGEGSPPRLPARNAARRSMALSSAALHDEAAYGTDSDDDGEEGGSPSAAASEEHRSTGTAAAAAGGAANGKKKHNPWSLAETEGLVEGVRLLGPSKWAEIKKLAVGGIAELLANRSAVDLKDKWRNLTRVAKLPKSVLKARAHKSTSDIPLDLLLTVKELMEVSRD